MKNSAHYSSFCSYKSAFTHARDQSSFSTSDYPLLKVSSDGEDAPRIERKIAPDALAAMKAGREAKKAKEASILAKRMAALAAAREAKKK